MLLGKDRGDGILMDGDLFQGVLLGLLAIGVIVLVALLATLGGIRKALEQRASQVAPERAGAAAQPGYGGSGRDTAAASQTTGTGGAATSVGASGQASSIRGVLEQHGLQGAQSSPTAGTAAAAESAAQDVTPQEQVVDSVFAAHADDPLEEPFQRDGRWWFRRGDELLLYDEATGQWQPAPDQTGPGASAPAAGAAQTQSVGTTTQAAPAVADAVATYWKCATCGAVNGSTAATCRMCFAARP